MHIDQSLNTSDPSGEKPGTARVAQLYLAATERLLPSSRGAGQSPERERKSKRENEREKTKRGAKKGSKFRRRAAGPN